MHHKALDVSLTVDFRSMGGVVCPGPMGRWIEGADTG